MFLPDYIWRVSFRRHSPFALSLEVVEKANKCKSFGPHLGGARTIPIFLRQIVSAIYRPPFGKVWLSSVCWSPSAKLGNELERRIYVEWVKNSGPILRRLWTEVHDDVGDHFWFTTRLLDYVRYVSFRRYYRPLKLPLSCEVVEKSGFGAADL